MIEEEKTRITPDEHPAFEPRSTKLVFLRRETGRSVYIVPVDWVGPEDDES